MGPNPLQAVRGIIAKAKQYRRIVTIAAVCTILLLPISAFLWFPWNDSRFINYTVACIPVVLTIFIAFVPDLKKAPMAVRILIVLIGAVWTALLWRQQALTQNDQERSINRAIDKSNEHSDKKIAQVRDDLKNTKDNLDTGLGKLSKLISASKSDLTSSIMKVKPAELQSARLQFSIFDPQRTFPVTSTRLRSDADGVFSIDFTVRNISNTAAKKVDLWVQICDDCAYAKEPEGFDKPRGIAESTRHRVLDVLNPGVSFEKMTIHTKLNKSFSFFQLAFSYSCEACGKMTATQTVKILVRENFKIPPMRLIEPIGPR